MASSVVSTTKKLAAERQIHAAINHYQAGDFECAITLCSAAEGLMPEPDLPTHLFAVLRERAQEDPQLQRDQFNYAATWLKHQTFNYRDDVELPEWLVKGWLNRAISKYRAVYGAGTAPMIQLFPWAASIGQ